MNYRKETKRKQKYELSSVNQHGERFKEAGKQDIIVCRMTATIDEATNLALLALLSDRLEVPLHFDFDSKPQSVWIEITSWDDVRKI